MNISFSDREARIIIREGEDQILCQRSLMKLSLEDTENHRNIALVEGQQKLQNYKSSVGVIEEKYDNFSKDIDALNAEIQADHKAHSEATMKEKEKLGKIQKDVAASKETIEQASPTY